MRATLILVLILTFGPCCRGLAQPVESVPAPAVNSNGSSAIPSGIANGAPLALTQPVSASGPSVPGDDPLAGAAQTVPAAIPSGIANGAPLALEQPVSASASSVPGDDPLVGAAQTAAAAPKIPTFPVQMYVRMGTSTHFELFFLNVKYGYDLSDFQFYNAWCLRKGVPLPGHTIHTVRLYNSTDPNVPPEYRRMELHEINYVINHKKGSKEDIQEAIWRLAKCCSTRTKMSPEALRLVREANLKGKDYTPGPGDLVGIICDPLKREQPLLIEYRLPPSIPPAVKPAIFTPSPLVGGSLSRIFIPPFFYWPSSERKPHHHPHIPEPSSLLLLATGMLGILVPRKVGRRLQGRQQH